MGAAIAFLGGAVGGAIVTQVVTLGRNFFDARIKRRSYARMLHEDFLRQQSTVARAYYRSTETRPCWWMPEEFLEAMATHEVYGELLGALRGQRYVAVASALGWMEYLRAACGAHQPAPLCSDLIEAYQRLGTARYALSKLGRLEYREHNHQQMRGDAAAARELDFSRAQAKKRLGGLKGASKKADRPTATTHPANDQETPESGA